MKRLVFIATTFALTLSIMATTKLNNGFEIFSTNDIIDEDEWILLGEAPLSNYYHNEDVITANIYIREIATKLICRVEYQGKYYATRWDNNSKSFLVTINEKTYKCDIPLDMRNEESENEGNAEYVGKWGFGSADDWYVDISLKNGEYSFFINPSQIDGEIIEKNVITSEFIFTLKSKTDYRPEMKSKGWSYMYDDCNKKADIGFPEKGQYKYDTSVLFATISISLTGTVPTHHVKKFHSYYYYQGELTYAETDTFDYPTPLVRK